MPRRLVHNHQTVQGGVNMAKTGERRLPSLSRRCESNVSGLIPEMERMGTLDALPKGKGRRRCRSERTRLARAATEDRTVRVSSVSQKWVADRSKDRPGLTPGNILHRTGPSDDRSFQTIGWKHRLNGIPDPDPGNKDVWYRLYTSVIRTSSCPRRKWDPLSSFDDRRSS